MKSQQVRLIDVFFLGPAMLAIAKQPKLTPLSRTFLAFTGGATVGYNLVNYLRHRQ